MHYARQGIVTPEMEYIALREKPKYGLPLRVKLLRKQHPGRKLWGETCKHALRPSLFVMKWREVEPLFRIILITQNPSR